MSDIEPLTNSSRELLNASMRKSVCIRDDNGWCCLYHAGFEDALRLVEARTERSGGGLEITDA